MTKEQLRRIIKEEISRSNINNPKFKKLNEASLGNLSAFDFDFDLETTRNMDCDETLPHTSYDGTNGDEEFVQAFLWVEKNGKTWPSISDDDGEILFEKAYANTAAALKVMKKMLRLTQVEVLIKNTKVLL